MTGAARIEAVRDAASKIRLAAMVEVCRELMRMSIKQEHAKDDRRAALLSKDGVPIDESTKLECGGSTGTLSQLTSFDVTPVLSRNSLRFTRWSQSSHLGKQGAKTAGARPWFREGRASRSESGWTGAEGQTRAGLGVEMLGSHHDDSCCTHGHGRGRRGKNYAPALEGNVVQPNLDFHPKAETMAPKVLIDCSWSWSRPRPSHTLSRLGH